MKQAPPDQDVLGQAIAEYFSGVRRKKLWVHMQTAGSVPDAQPSGRAPRAGRDVRAVRDVPAATSGQRVHFFPREEMPIKTYFRTTAQMPELEWVALQSCRGRILDIGAGAGSHALALQQLGQDVTALEISRLAATVIKARGVQHVVCKDFFTLRDARRFDTLLLLMNGIGIAGNLSGLRAFLRQARALSRPGATLVFDSSDISYLFRNNPSPAEYYGELSYQYEYRKQLSKPFPWLFIDQKTLTRIAAEEGWQTKILFEDGDEQYLARCF
jgi:SAM-dependent methyltransferase